MAAENPARDARPCLLVLGMHRSGTSLLARGLIVLGARLGDALMPALACNPRGFFEDEDIQACNRALLQRLGLTWHSPQPVVPRDLLALADSPLGADAVRLVRAKCADLGPGAVPAFKDPRLCRLMSFWRPVLAAAGLAPRCILALRCPGDVARSLAVRDGMDAEAACRLWLCHMLDALDGSRGLPRIVTAHERLLENPGRELGRLAHGFGLAVDKEALRDFVHGFLDPSLAHHHGADAGTGSCAVLAERLHAALEPAACAPTPEAAEAGLAAPRLFRLRRQILETLGRGGA